MLGSVSGAAAFAVFYAHYSQTVARERMHRGVLRELEKEAAEAAAAAATLAGSAAAAAAAAAADPACDNGVCDLKRTRFREPSLA